MFGIPSFKRIVLPSLKPAEIVNQLIDQTPDQFASCLWIVVFVEPS